MVSLEVFFESWFFFPLVGLFLGLLGRRALREEDGWLDVERLRVYYTVIAGIGVLFTLGLILIPSYYEAVHPSSRDPFYVLMSSFLFGLWLVVPFFGLGLYALSRFIPYEREAHGAALLFSVVTFIFGIPLASLCAWVVAALSNL